MDEKRNNKQLPMLRLIALLGCVCSTALYSKNESSVNVLSNIDSTTSPTLESESDIDFDEAYIDNLFKMSIRDLSELKVVTATKKVQLISQAPAIMTVITAMQIRDRGYRNLSEVLENIVGIDVITDHFQADVGIRGLHSGKRSYSRIVKVMIDGQSIAFRPSSDNYLDESLLPMSVIERVEVIKGPNSALYGADAYLGVVNIITRSGDGIDKGIASIEGVYLEGNPGTAASFMYGNKIDNLEYLIGGYKGRIDRSGLSPLDLEGKSIYTDSTTKNDISRPENMYAKIVYSKENSFSSGVDFNLQHVDAHGEFQDWSTIKGTNRNALYNWYLRGQAQKYFSRNIDFNISVSHSQGRPASEEKLEGTRIQEWTTREVDYKGYDVKSELSYSFDDFTSLTLGGDYSFEDHKYQVFYENDTSGLHLPTGGIQDSVTPTGTLSNSGIYVQGIVYPGETFGIEPLKRLGLTAGVRLDKHSTYKQQVTYRTALVYSFFNGSYAKLLYGTSFKAPSPSQLYSTFIRTQDVIANPNLEPEEAQIIDLQVVGILPMGFGININGFYSTTKNKVEIVLNQNSVTQRFNQPENLANITSYGIESQIDFLYTGLHSYVNYSFQNTNISFPYDNLGVDETVTFKTAQFPTHMLKFGINKKIAPYYLNLNLEGRVIGERTCTESNCREVSGANVDYVLDRQEYYNNRYTLDSYMLTDAMISSHGLQLINTLESEFRFKVYNVFNTQYGYPGFKGTNAAFNTPGQGRWYSLSVIQHF